MKNYNVTLFLKKRRQRLTSGTRVYKNYLDVSLLGESRRMSLDGLLSTLECSEKISEQ